MGDRDVNSTNCPGDNLYPLLNDLWVQSSPLEDDMTPEQFAAMIGPPSRVRVSEGVVELNLRKEDGTDDGWWPVGDVWEFTHRHIKAIAEK